MKTAIDREYAFRKDLRMLLEKHDTLLEFMYADKVFNIYGGRTRVTMFGRYDKDNNTIAEHNSFILTK